MILNGSEAVMTEVIVADVKPRVSRFAVAMLTLMTAAVSMTVRILWIERFNQEIDPKGWGAVPFAAVLG
jgi:hypothetical protein